MSIKEYDITQLIPKPSKVKRPSFFKEVRSVIQPIRLVAAFKGLSKAKAGEGRRILLFPGWKSHETVMLPVKAYLNRLGYDAQYWGLGFNNGRVEKYRDQMIERLTKEENKDKITLIGWSLGGLVAREVARALPHKIANVITYGTPAVGGPRHTIGAKVYGAKEVQRIVDLQEELDATNPIRVPLSIIFTKKDSIVNWSACLDKTSLDVKHFEVNSTHLSLGIDPSVWKIIVQELENRIPMV
ncbi:MAG: pimeloyl-ACP methyl ester carboxylesterase [Paraglaciecola sp.]|jgi:pimeloyl-ACP methyl ester carboxylesterase